MNSIWKVSELISEKVELNFIKGESFANRYGKTKAAFFKGAPFKGEDTEIFAYYGVPKCSMPKGGYPGIVLVHGGGGMAFYEWVEYWNSKGYAAIAFDHSSRVYGSIHIEGKPCNLLNPKGGPKDCFNIFTATEKNCKDHWIYHAVNSAVLCFNALRDTGVVNPDKIALTGVSWGSVIGTIAISIDQRFSCFAPLYGGGYLTETKLFDICEHEDFNYEDWFKQFDPSNYIVNNRKPIHFTFGLNDPAFSPVSNAKTYALSMGDVSYSERKALDHGHLFMEHRGTKNVFYFIDSVINNNPMPFKVTESKIENGYLIADIDKVKNAKKAVFNYTFENLDDSRKSAEWAWESVEIPVDNMKVKIPENATACMIEISDGNKIEYVQSTKVFLLK